MVAVRLSVACKWICASLIRAQCHSKRFSRSLRNAIRKFRADNRDMKIASTELRQKQWHRHMNADDSLLMQFIRHFYGRTHTLTHSIWMKTITIFTIQSEFNKHSRRCTAAVISPSIEFQWCKLFSIRFKAESCSFYKKVYVTCRSEKKKYNSARLKCSAQEN